MTPRDVLKRAVEFRRPPRLPITGHGALSDAVHVGYEPIRPDAAGDDERVDHWLCRWHRTDQPNMGQVAGHPLEDLSGMDEFPWPDPDDGRYYDVTRRRLAEIAADERQRERYRGSGIFMVLWERMQALHGFENCMLDLMDDTPEIHELADRILDYDIRLVRNLHRVCGSELDQIGFSEDWGTQIDLHISPALWRSFFFPRYRRLFGVIHECGYHVQMHSCGRINKAIGGLIEAGLDVINMQQPLTNGIEEIGREFAGRICFESLCDIQKTLPRGDRDEIDAQARLLPRSWGTPDGGFILGDYGGHEAIGADPDVKRCMVDAFRREDPWANGWN